MNDKPVIIAALAIFIVLATFPIWYTLGYEAYFSGDASLPDLEPPAGARLFSAELSAADVSLESLRDEFGKHQISLSDGASLAEPEQGGTWRIVDQQNRYLVLKSQEDEGTVDVYNGCVHDKDFMNANHMNLLIEWREAVVRGGDTSEIEINGKKYPKSLTRCCMKCHNNRQTFCYRCHVYANVMSLQPVLESATVGQSRRGIRCWGCHVEPKGG